MNGQLTLKPARAIHPSDRGSIGGSTHLTVSLDYARGRLARRQDDALCKPRAKFWGLYPSEGDFDGPCSRCTAIALRHGLKVPEGWPS